MPTKKASILEGFDVESPVATEFRRIYQNIRAMQGEKRSRAILMTSAMRGEGKSTVTSYLAATIAQYRGRKVLVVDADLRRPTVHSNFNLPNEVGLSNCLSGDVDPLDAVQKTEIPNLDIIPSGERPAAPSRLFESDLLSEFFGKVKFYYDIVLIDSAPVLAVSDSLFLCSEADGVVFVVLAGITAKELVHRAVAHLKDSNANILGAVVNNATEILPYHYDYDYYGYGKE